jgi:hypothetical protein
MDEASDAEDTDGLYLVGGSVKIQNSTITGAMDDCIDVGTGAGGSMFFHEVTVFGCLHEGFALSVTPHELDCFPLAGIESASSHQTACHIDLLREVQIHHSSVQYAQHGIELGHSGKHLSATVLHTEVRQCDVGLKVGDNYNWPVLGRLTIDESVFVANRVHVRDARIGSLQGIRSPPPDVRVQRSIFMFAARRDGAPLTQFAHTAQMRKQHFGCIQFAGWGNLLVYSPGPLHGWQDSYSGEDIMDNARAIPHSTMASTLYRT